MFSPEQQLRRDPSFAESCRAFRFGDVENTEQILHRLDLDHHKRDAVVSRDLISQCLYTPAPISFFSPG
jgi:hypothetical protein